MDIKLSNYIFDNLRKVHTNNELVIDYPIP